jgi:hypothetical protein
MNITRSFALAIAVLAGLAWASTDAHARRFTYTYQSGVADKGEVEFASWTTMRTQQDVFYRGFDQRMEFEVGIASRLQTAWYLNFAAVAQDESPDVRQSDVEWAGVSNEWIYHLQDAVADPFGMALYFEWGLAPTEADFEFKLILDKRAGDFLTAFNATVEPEWDYESAETESAINLEIDLAAAYFLSSAFSLGAEMHNYTVWADGGGSEYSALLLGPVASYASDGWEATVTVLPQIATLSGDDPAQHNKLETRLIFGIDLR